MNYYMIIVSIIRKKYIAPQIYIEREKLLKHITKIEKSFSSFIVEYEDKNIIDFYFEVDDKNKEKISNNIIKNEISSFLSILKNI